MAGGNVTDWICFFSKVLRAGLENQLPIISKTRCVLPALVSSICRVKKRARIVGKEHYDLGNDLFSRMLDPFMQYSCAYWKDADNLNLPSRRSSK
ncbi:class I SAM-dependent methyltransferase [Escherichia coli]